MSSAPEAKVILTAQDKTAAAFRQAKAGLRDFGSAVSSVQGALAGLGVGISFAAVIRGFASAARSAIEFGDEVQKASARTGISAARFATMANAAKLADVDMATLSKGLRAMQVALSEASTGGKAQQETFAALGLTFQQLKALKPEDQFLLILDRISALRDPTDKARAGTDLFAKAWMDLAPFAEQGAESIRKATAEIEAMGGALTDEQIQKLADADEAIKKLDLSWQGFARTLTAAVAPKLAGILQSLTLVVETVQKNGWLTTWGDVVAAGEAQRASAGAPKLPATWNGLSAGVMARSARITPPGFTPATPKAPKGSKADTPAASLSQLYAYAFNDLDIQTRADTAEFFQGLKDQWKGIEIATKQAVEPISQMTVFADQAARNVLSSFSDFLFDPFKDGLDGMLAGFIDTIRRMVAEMAAQQILQMVFSAIGGGETTGWRGAFTTMASSVAGARANGGPVSAGSTYLVGERGPEMFVPRSSGTIIPNGAGGGLSVVYNIDASGADADRIMAILPPLLKQTEDLTIARVRDLNSRGRM